MISELAQITDRVELGDHVCAFAGNADDLVDATAGMVRAGLRDGQQVMVFTDSLLPVALAAGLLARGVDVEAAGREDQVRFLPARPEFLPYGRFDPDEMLASVDRYIAAAAAGGFAGLRMLGDMAWTLDAPAGIERLAWYEAQLSSIYMDTRALGICLYDTQGLDRTLLQHVVCAHPATAHTPARGPGWAPLLQLRRTWAPYGLQVVGECDISNRQALVSALRAVLDSRTGGQEPAIVDVSQLRFADAATGALLLRRAQEEPTGMKLVGAQGSLAMVIRLLGGDDLPNIAFAGQDR